MASADKADEIVLLTSGVNIARACAVYGTLSQNDQVWFAH